MLRWFWNTSKLSHTVIDIKGKERLEGVTIAKVDENRRPIEGTRGIYTLGYLTSFSRINTSKMNYLKNQMWNYQELLMDL